MIENKDKYIKELEDENDLLKDQLLLINALATFIIKTSLKLLEDYDGD